MFPPQKEKGSLHNGGTTLEYEKRAILIGCVLGIEVDPLLCDPAAAATDGTDVAYLLEPAVETGEGSGGEQRTVGDGGVTVGSHQRGPGVEVLVAGLCLEEGVGVRLLLLVEHRLVGCIVEAVGVVLVGICTHYVHAGEVYVLQLELSVLCCLYSGALLAVYDQTDRPAEGYGVDTVETGRTANLHGCLEEAERRTVVGIVGTTVDILYSVLKLVIEHLGAYESDVAESGCGVRRNLGTVSTVVALEAIAS